MNPDNQEPTFEESIQELLKDLPPAIRRYIASEEYATVLRRVVANYRLTIAQAVVLERELILLVVGIETPRQFVDALMDEGQIPSNTVGNIVDVVNSQILIPIQDAMRHEWEAQEHTLPARPVQPEAPRSVELSPGERLIAAVAAGGLEPVIATPPTPKAWQPKAADTVTVLPQGIYAPPLQSPRYTSQPLVPDAYIHETIPLNKLQELGGVKKPSRPATATTTPEPAVRAATASTPQVREEAPLTRRLETDTLTPDHLLEDHEEPHMEVPGVHTVPRQTLFSTFPTGGFSRPRSPVGPGSAPQATVPVPPRPSQTLPGSLPSTPVEKAAPPRPIVPVPLAPVAPPSHYGVDPYREPLEDKG